MTKDSSQYLLRFSITNSGKRPAIAGDVYSVFFFSDKEYLSLDEECKFEIMPVFSPSGEFIRNENSHLMQYEIDKYNVLNAVAIIWYSRIYWTDPLTQQKSVKESVMGWNRNTFGFNESFVLYSSKDLDMVKKYINKFKVNIEK